MNDAESSFIAGLVVGIIIGIIAGLIITFGVMNNRIDSLQSGSYKKGQIDAMTGIVKYDLVKQKDDSVIWELKKEK
jgi:hypothetical protein